MEYLAPPLKAILQIRFSIENGKSLKGALQGYISENNDEFALQIQDWFSDIKGHSNKVMKSHNFLRSQFFSVMKMGLNGQPISKELLILEEEMMNISKEDIHAHLDRLPSIALIPLLSLQFPAFMMVLLGPILKVFTQTFGG